MSDATSGTIGRAVKRREDVRFLTGRGRYVADLALDHAAHVAIVRSPHAHARIVRIDGDAARGRFGVFTLADLPELRGALPPPVVPGVAVKPYRQSALAERIVRFAGEAVAVVVGDDAYAAADGAAAVTVDYEPLPAAVDPEAALAPGAPLVHADWGTNEAAAVTLETGDFEAARRLAALVVTRPVRCARLTALPLEPRAVAARWDRATGSLHVWSGAPSQGQGHETTLAKVCADRLGIALESVDVRGGDTDRFPTGAGTYASRVAVIVGNAAAQAADAVRDRARRVAARGLECDPDDVVIADGRAHVKGAPDRGLGLAQLAALSHRADVVRLLGEPGLAATRYASPERVTWASGVHVATVEVDRETGAVSVCAYHAAHDAGREINPLVVEGQTQGGAAQGIGAALGEAIVYDASGQVLTATLMDYPLPRAGDVPAIAVAGCDSLSPLNALGIKGTGEGSAVPGPAAIANAVADALGAESPDLTDVPLRPHALARRA